MADMSSFVEQLKNFDVSDIDFNRVGVWPAPAKIFLCIVVSAALFVACYYGFIQERKDTLQREVATEQSKKQEFENKAHEAANLDKYREQMKQMEESFGALVHRLPTDTEVPGLLEDIDDKGEESHLEINSIDLQPEKVGEFHVELPIKISVTGGYHEFGSFVSGIAGMPRIVTLHDFTIVPKAQDQSGLLTMTVMAKTYRYKAKE